MPVGGPFQIGVRVVNSVNVLSGNVIADASKGPTLVIINMVNVLGAVELALLNPLALYCISGVSVLQQVNVTACAQSNVTFGGGVQVFTNNQVNVVNCI